MIAQIKSILIICEKLSPITWANVHELFLILKLSYTAQNNPLGRNKDYKVLKTH